MRYELRVATLLSQAALATFRVPVRPTAMPRDTVYRFLVPADRDAFEVLHRLIECDVEVLEIRRCLEPTRRDWSRLLSELAGQLDDGRVYDRDLPGLGRALEPVLRSYRIVDGTITEEPVVVENRR